MVNLPNKITLFRIALIPLFIILLYINDVAAAIIFVFLMATDTLDGYVARRHKLITTVGKFLDPLADKLVIVAALVFLIGQGVEAWMAFLIIAREISVTGFRLIAVSKDIVIPASVWGKIKTFSQIVAVVFVLLKLPFAWHIMLIAVILTLISGIDYFLASRKILR